MRIGSGSTSPRRREPAPSPGGASPIAPMLIAHLTRPALVSKGRLRVERPLVEKTPGEVSAKIV